MVQFETDLVKAVNGKNEKAWKMFFQAYYEALCNHGFRILQDENVVEDIVQELFIRLWDGNMTFENEKALTVYLYRSVTNNVLKYLRDHKSEVEKLKKWSAEEEGVFAEDEFSSVVREEVLRQLRDLIRQLPASRRDIILMSMEGMSGEEISEKLGVSINTVKQQKYRAYKYIKERLGDSWVLTVLFFL